MSPVSGATLLVEGNEEEDNLSPVAAMLIFICVVVAIIALTFI